jgi:hypothetical protein
MIQALAAASASTTLAGQLFHHKRLMVDERCPRCLKTEHHGVRSVASKRPSETLRPSSIVSGLRSTSSHATSSAGILVGFVNRMHRKPLTMIRSAYESFISLRSRGGPVFPRSPDLGARPPSQACPRPAVKLAPSQRLLLARRVWRADRQSARKRRPRRPPG